MLIAVSFFSNIGRSVYLVILFAGFSEASILTSSMILVLTLSWAQKVCHIEVADLAQASAATNAEGGNCVAVHSDLIVKTKILCNRLQPEPLGDS